VVKNIIKLNVQGVPIEIEDCLPTKEENKERRDVLVAVRKGTFTPKDKNNQYGMILQVKMKLNTRGAAISIYHQALLTCPL
jgi:hypothetical protein